MASGRPSSRRQICVTAVTLWASTANVGDAADDLRVAALGEIGHAFHQRGAGNAHVGAPEGSGGESGRSAESYVATGGGELPELIRAAYADSARAADPAEARALLDEGDRAAESASAAIRNAFARATGRIYWLTAALMVVATTLSIRIPELPLRTTHDRIAAESGDGSGIE